MRRDPVDRDAVPLMTTLDPARGAMTFTLDASADHDLRDRSGSWQILPDGAHSSLVVSRDRVDPGTPPPYRRAVPRGAVVAGDDVQPSPGGGPACHRQARLPCRSDHRRRNSCSFQWNNRTAVCNARHQGKKVALWIGGSGVREPA